MWKIKVLIQFLLAKIPFGEKLNHQLQKLEVIRRKGTKPQQIKNRIISLTKNFVDLLELDAIQDKIVVEVGTGWMPIPTLLMYVLGAKKIYTYDHIKHARLNLANEAINEIYILADNISQLTNIPIKIIKERINRLKNAASIDELFLQANIEYHAPSDAANTKIKNNQVDLYYSHAVFEHFPKKGIYDITKEAKRVLKREGIFYSLIGLHDHYAGFDKKISKINFLKYPDWLWDFFIQNNISYHNRMREIEFINIFNEFNGNIIKLKSVIDPNDLDLMKKIKINKKFKNFSDEQNATTTTEIFVQFK